MAPQLKASRASTKGHMTRTIALISAFRTKVMTREELENLEILETKLKGLYEVYKEASRKIEEELNSNDADQAEYDEEQETNLLTQDEILTARAVIKMKKQEWLDATKKKEKEEEEKERKKRKEEKGRKRKKTSSSPPPSSRSGTTNYI